MIGSRSGKPRSSIQWPAMASASAQDQPSSPRPRSAGGSGPAQNALATALTIDSTKLATFEGRVASRFGYTFGSPQFYDASIATGAGFGVQGAQTSVIYGGSTAVAAFEDGANGIRLPGVRSLGWVDGHALANVADVRLWRDAANTLALRNSTTAQAFNIYNTYTSGTSYERYSVDWITTANLVIVGPNKGSAGGTQRVQRLSYLEDGGAGSTVPLLGSTCPAASGTVKSWIKVITSDGTTAYVPCWA